MSFSTVLPSVFSSICSSSIPIVSLAFDYSTIISDEFVSDISFSDVEGNQHYNTSQIDWQSIKVLEYFILGDSDLLSE